jgi:3-hydroxy-3-methylglutaryl CoA synthase
VDRSKSVMSYIVAHLNEGGNYSAQVVVVVGGGVFGARGGRVTWGLGSGWDGRGVKGSGCAGCGEGWRRRCRALFALQGCSKQVRPPPLQGADNVHGCYGGTAALLHAADWVSGPSWDGRLALVVATDIAVYEEGSPARATGARRAAAGGRALCGGQGARRGKSSGAARRRPPARSRLPNGPARPCHPPPTHTSLPHATTGGAGAAAMLIGPDAPLALEPPPARATFCAHAFDFFKPHSRPVYPVVDGPATLLWYARASDAAGAALAAALAAADAGGEEGGGGGGGGSGGQLPLEGSGGARRPPLPPLLPRFDFYLAHAPFNKMVRKTFARLALQDALRAAAAAGGGGGGAHGCGCGGAGAGAGGGGCSSGSSGGGARAAVAGPGFNGGRGAVLRGAAAAPSGPADDAAPEAAPALEAAPPAGAPLAAAFHGGGGAILAPGRPAGAATAAAAEAAAGPPEPSAAPPPVVPIAAAAAAGGPPACGAAAAGVHGGRGATLMPARPAAAAAGAGGGAPGSAEGAAPAVVPIAAAAGGGPPSAQLAAGLHLGRGAALLPAAPAAAAPVGPDTGAGAAGSGAALAPPAGAPPPPPLPPPPREAAGLDPEALPDSSIGDKGLEAAALAASAPLYDRMVAPGAAAQRRLGNLYTASLYSGLAGLLEHHRAAAGPAGGVCSSGGAAAGGGSGGAGAQGASGRGGGGGGSGGGAAALDGRRLLLYSYGSGVQATLLALRCRRGAGRFSLDAMIGSVRGRAGGRLEGVGVWGSAGGAAAGGIAGLLTPPGGPPPSPAAPPQQDLARRLDARLRRSAAEFGAAMAALQAAHAAAPYAPAASLADLEPGTVYLERVDASHRRHYARTPRA